MRFGVYLPTFAWRDLGFEPAARVKEFARKAEGLGFDALWVAEHFLEAPGTASQMCWKVSSASFGRSAVR